MFALRRITDRVQREGPTSAPSMVRLLDELLRPGGERHLQIAMPAPEAPPSDAPEAWGAWLAQRQRTR